MLHPVCWPYLCFDIEVQVILLYSLFALKCGQLQYKCICPCINCRAIFLCTCHLEICPPKGFILSNYDYDHYIWLWLFLFNFLIFNFLMSNMFTDWPTRNVRKSSFKVFPPPVLLQPLLVWPNKHNRLHLPCCLLRTKRIS